jgi:energy-coupling factor transporter ATP-binding protein EcfA2
VSARSQRVLDRLVAVGFRVRPGSLALFGDELPLVTGVAWDAGTAQLAFIAEMGDETDGEQWRQLLFAGSGIRHQLAGDGPTAFGTPVILAIVDDDGERRLRELTEDLVRRYALFSRVDLNLVRHRSLANDDTLDDALAPLLPRCRAMLGQQISRADVQRFWSKLEREVQTAAEKLDDVFGAFRADAGRKCAKTLIGDDADAPELPAPSPIAALTLHNFRSFAEESLALSQVSIVHGTNGSGKTTVVEALELLWARTSQRRPGDVDVEDYARHVARNGKGTFTVHSSQVSVSSVADEPIVELPRSVLNHETAAELVSRSPDARYAGFLNTTGLEIPNLKTRTASLVADAKRAADTALEQAGLPRLQRSDSHGQRHLAGALSGNFAKRLPQTHEVVGLEQTLALISSGMYQPRRWDDQQVASAALARADELMSAVLIDQPDPRLIADALDTAAKALHTLTAARRSAASAGRRLLDAIARHQVPVATSPQERAARRDVPAPLPVDLAVRWLAHGSAVSDASRQFRADAQRLTDVKWAERLAAYADALDIALAVVPRDELEPWTHPRRVPIPSPVPAPSIEVGLYVDAGFVGQVEHPEQLVVPLTALVAQLQQDADALERLTFDIEQHPGRNFADHVDHVLAAICRFELARTLRREGPIMTASEDLVAELLRERLAPVVRELVAAIVRFEWYFQPLLIPHDERKVVLGGLSTTDPNLDARLVLNSAERTVVGLAWFLGLHLLQPESRRQVLVLDDPTAAFDVINQAGFISTLRAFVRLSRPGQLVITSHDDGLATLFADEFAPVDGWPSAVARIRCERDVDDASIAVPQPGAQAASTVDRELHLLGLLGETALLS